MESTSERIAFKLILHAGNARTFSMQAISLAKLYKFSEAHDKIKEAEIEVNEAHQIQANLIRSEADGEQKVQLNLLLIHAQDHLMNALTVKDLAGEMIEMYEKFKKIERE